MPLVACLLALNLIALVNIAKRYRETLAGLRRLHALLKLIRTEQQAELQPAATPMPIVQTEHEGVAA